ncbi:MAG: D-ribose pyranase [Succinivibrio dextrinosolvens]|uniref:D-ribose pyranase n=1 Tax=Succinivibrio dextrinosolvens TaxID=83771 RepID=A0A662Z6D2_9GAMM|nr:MULTISPECIES: D-ribose pyranase [Succinivibrio]MBQ3883471.1 D-ribose pyranase [Succinivibrio sp.]MBQ9221784.1 D-ribose pyranase [Succinivibrio sp.]MDY6416934.1 D-ribose pyranase [Succinivibrio dextrinosolvens]MDY6420614.1 D-ribose pyranase [Succinivibrio dextrinosolvens]MDY6465632.1 D-ribose pyranase [Succinivibrio dextrinosolvens]
MKKIGCLNSELSYVISKLGHFDTLTIGDCGLPVPRGVQRIDLAVTYGVPGFFDVFDVVDAEAKFQKVTIASESKTQNPVFYEKITSWAQKNGVEVVEVPHEVFKAGTVKSVAVVRTGECKPYSNVILESNVSF